MVRFNQARSYVGCTEMGLPQIRAVAFYRFGPLASQRETLDLTGILDTITFAGSDRAVIFVLSCVRA